MVNTLGTAYSELWTGDTWRNVHGELRRLHGPNAFALPIVVYSDGIRQDTLRPLDTACMHVEVMWKCFSKIAVPLFLRREKRDCDVAFKCNGVMTYSTLFIYQCTSIHTSIALLMQKQHSNYSILVY